MDDFSIFSGLNCKCDACFCLFRVSLQLWSFPWWSQLYQTAVQGGWVICSCVHAFVYTWNECQNVWLFFPLLLVGATPSLIFFFFLSNIPFIKGFSSFEQVWHCNLVMQWSVQPEASNANVTVLLRFMSLNCSIMLTDRHLVATITWNYLWVIIYFVLTRPHTLIPVIV